MMATMVLSACTSDDPPSAGRDGPLRVPPEHGWATVASVGHPFTDGLETIEFDGDQAVVIEEIEFDGDPELRLVGSELAANDQGLGIIQYLPEFPPPHQSMFGEVGPAEGATLEPRGPNQPGPELLLGIEIVKPGRFEREAVIIAYRVNGELFEARFPAQLIVCTSDFAEPDGTCSVED